MMKYKVNIHFYEITKCIDPPENGKPTQFDLYFNTFEDAHTMLIVDLQIKLGKLYSEIKLYKNILKRIRKTKGSEV